MVDGVAETAGIVGGVSETAGLCGGDAPMYGPPGIPIPGACAPGAGDIPTGMAGGNPYGDGAPWFPGIVGPPSGCVVSFSTSGARCTGIDASVRANTSTFGRCRCGTG